MSNIEKYFNIDRGPSGLTEELIYNNWGRIPVISATSDKFFIFGHVDENAVKEYVIDYPTVLIIRVGKAGMTQIVNLPKYVVTENVLYLYPREEFKDEFDLDWLEQRLQYLLLRNAKGDIKGQRNISSEMIYPLKFETVDIDIQKRVGNLLSKAQRLKRICAETISRLAKLETAKISIKVIEQQTLYKVFDIVGGNNGLTDEFIYNNQPINEVERIPIFSGATLEENFMGYVSKSAKLNDNDLRIFEGPAILVSRKGCAGQMSYMPKGQFTINDDAYVMNLKQEYVHKVDLKWFVNCYQTLFSNIVTSKSGNATFNKEYAERQLIQIPKRDDQAIVIRKIQQLQSTIIKFRGIVQKINNVLEYSIV
jgi:hypothetical protein